MPTRRHFLRHATTGAAALAALPLSGRTHTPPIMTNKSTIGHGEFTYQVDANWGSLDPGKHPLQHCHEMVLDSRGRLLCSSVAPQHDVLVYNKDGRLLQAWRHELPEPHGLTKVGEGEDQTFWITDVTEGRVVNLDLEGRVLRELDAPPTELLGDKDYKPTETTVADNGDIYVADGYGSQKIFRFDDRGRLQDNFGGPDHFSTAHGIVVDRRTPTPTLLITSRSANEFQRWTLDGKHLKTYALPGLSICRPVIHGEDTYFAVIVTDSWYMYDGMVAVLDKDMRVVSLPGGSAPPEVQASFKSVKSDGTFMNPHDVCLDEDDNVYVPQWYSGRTYPIRLRRV